MKRLFWLKAKNGLIIILQNIYSEYIYMYIQYCSCTSDKKIQWLVLVEEPSPSEKCSHPGQIIDSHVMMSILQGRYI